MYETYLETYTVIYKQASVEVERKRKVTEEKRGAKCYGT